MPFTLRNLKEDLEDVGSNFDGAPDLEFRMATQALALEQSGLSYQSVMTTTRWSASVAGSGSPGCRKSDRWLEQMNSVVGRRDLT